MFPENCRKFIQIKSINITIAQNAWRIDYVSAPYVFMYYLSELLGGEKLDNVVQTTFNVISLDKLPLLGKLFDNWYFIQLFYIPKPHYMDTYYVITHDIY